MDEDDVANAEFIDDVNRFASNRLDIENDRCGHYDLSQLNEKLTTGQQLLNVGKFERISSTPPNGLIIDDEIVSNFTLHHQTGVTKTGNLLDNNLDIKTLDVNMVDCNSDGYITSISSSGVSSVCGTTGSNDISPSSSSYASACCSSSCNSSATDSTCSQSPPPLSTTSSTSSIKLKCKLLTKLLANSNGQFDNEHLSTKNLQLKMQLNQQLNKQFSKLNKQSNDKMNHKFNSIHQDDYLLINKSNSTNMINNNYLKNFETLRPTTKSLTATKPDFKSNLINKSMINLNQYNQLNDYQFKANENNLNDEIIAVKTNSNMSPKFKLNNSTSNLSTFKSINNANTVSLSTSDSSKSDFIAFSSNNQMNRNSIVSRQIEQLEQLNENCSTVTTTNHLFKNPDNEDDLSSGSSSLLSTCKYNGSDKSYITAKGIKKTF